MEIIDVVTINRADYDALLNAAARYDVLTAGIFCTARLSSYSGRLVYDDSALNALMMAVVPIRFENRVRELEKERGAE